MSNYSDTSFNRTPSISSMACYHKSTYSYIDNPLKPDSSLKRTFIRPDGAQFKGVSLNVFKMYTVEIYMYLILPLFWCLKHRYTRGVARNKSMYRHHYSRGVRGHAPFGKKWYPISPQLHFRTWYDPSYQAPKSPCHPSAMPPAMPPTMPPTMALPTMAPYKVRCQSTRPCWQLVWAVPIRGILVQEKWTNLPNSSYGLYSLCLTHSYTLQCLHINLS